MDFNDGDWGFGLGLLSTFAAIAAAFGALGGAVWLWPVAALLLICAFVMCWWFG
jgi:hypothetical protein